MDHVVHIRTDDRQVKFFTSYTKFKKLKHVESYPTWRSWYVGDVRQVRRTDSNSDIVDTSGPKPKGLKTLYITHVGLDDLTDVVNPDSDITVISDGYNFRCHGDTINVVGGGTRSNFTNLFAALDMKRIKNVILEDILTLTAFTGGQIKFMENVEHLRLTKTSIPIVGIDRLFPKLTSVELPEQILREQMAWAQNITTVTTSGISMKSFGQMLINCPKLKNFVDTDMYSIDNIAMTLSDGNINVVLKFTINTNVDLRTYLERMIKMYYKLNRLGLTDRQHIEYDEIEPGDVAYKLITKRTNDMETFKQYLITHIDQCYEVYCEERRGAGLRGDHITFRSIMSTFGAMDVIYIMLVDTDK